MKDLIKKIIPEFLINYYHFLLAMLGAFFYGFPSRQKRTSPNGTAKKMVVIGVTGTNGKSTVVNLTTKILEEEGFKVASLSSISFKIWGKEWLNTLKMTMPGRFKLQKFLRQALDSGCQFCVLEVTSEGILQHRHRFIDFDVAVFTNLTPEHIEAHGSFEKYREAKGKLFQAAKKIHIVNLDDENAQYFLRFLANKKYGYSIGSKSQANKRINILNVKNYKISSDGLKFSLDNIEFELNLLAKFNIYNALAAICIGLSQGVDFETCKLALEKVKKIPGRMEIVIKNPFKVFVDYAFTPNALEKVYRIISQEFRPKNLICVLGSCGGGRDKWKRPILGKLASKYCNQVIVTNEDPYDEDPIEIIEQIDHGTKGKAKKILDRKKAIREALKIAKSGDAVIITGKGCEPWICVAGGRKIPWDDRRIVREEFKNLKIIDF
ncbi:UDP-N-acetylmuramoyl-L-alanyl-D-glutamate--2,6-diaminopimelate ligase [Patescibacteria group bacterium]|nr:UDP-N-acetylmuramoyl-L-alanyl-D-glutamate--2,6-diaminopimelate ligase [Patescibacteria group bacterium]